MRVALIRKRLIEIEGTDTRLNGYQTSTIVKSVIRKTAVAADGLTIWLLTAVVYANRILMKKGRELA